VFGIGRGDKTLRIRQATLEDLPRIVDIGAKAFPYIREPQNFFLDRLRNFWVFVAEVDGHVLGFVDVEVKRDEAKIAGIAVDEAERGRGIGSALMSFALEFLKKLGISRVTLLARASNEPAVKMYRKFGFLQGKHIRDDVYEWYKVLR